MYLYLVQHAEAKQKEEDPDRSLTEYGLASIRRVSTYVARNTDVKVQTIIHSGKKRAHQTADVLAEALNPPKRPQVGKELDPMSQPWSWVERLAKIEEDIMLVGHLPNLRRLSDLLLCQDESKQVIEFQMGCIISFVRDESGLWSIRWMITPQIVPEM
jgi:phosphohistidine phosphatase